MTGSTRRAHERPFTKPVPVPDESSEGYWSAAAQHVLALARCRHCGGFSMPPGAVCAVCTSTDPQFEFVPVSGRGRIRSWTVIHDSFLPGFEADLPFVIVDVEVDEQPELRMIGRLVDGPDAVLHVGDAVDAVFEEVAPQVAVPAFALRAAR
jgi:uncharacterized OB-fold protein